MPSNSFPYHHVVPTGIRATKGRSVNRWELGRMLKGKGDLFSSESSLSERLLSMLGAAQTAFDLEWTAELRHLMPRYTQDGSPVARQEERPDEKEAFYAQLEKFHDSCSRKDIKDVIGDMSTQIGRVNIYKPVIGPHSQHTDIYKTTWRSPTSRTANQIDEVLIDGRFFLAITNVHTNRGADIGSDPYLVAISLRLKLFTVYHARHRRTTRLNIKQLKDPQTVEEHAKQFEAILPTAEGLGASPLENGWCSIRTAIEETTTTILLVGALSGRN
ncbi:uncharacterized protein LOC129728366 [Wyeomyia smithii]|uniref:uncharacterized protein LOC129728366 n=1 Tax=Wyeomyia smithii TaxID=174621 RepID=UPI00246802E5|nr:uncharacterized protein LOC129728366 [Wyeomyia smithii]